MNAYPMYTSVVISDVGFKGKITAILLRGLTLSYEITFWNNGSLHTEWLQEHGFHVASEIAKQYMFGTAP